MGGETKKQKKFRLKSSEHVSFRLENIQVSLCYTNATITENNMDVPSLTVTEQVGSWTGGILFEGWPTRS